jgi:CubicO group peptidase (beta-lactamase class C family)
MHFKHLWIAVGLLLPSYDPSFAAEDPPGNAPIRQLIESQASEDAPGLAVALLVEGRVAFESARGLANLNSKTAIGPDTQFYLASLSKQFTSMAVALLEDRGLLKFDEPLASVLSDLPAPLHGITLDQMLRHTSGLGDYLANPFPPQTNERVLERVRSSKELLFSPGTEHRYSNTGYNLLATCVQTASQQPFPDFMKKEIFAPLGMTNTQVCTSLTNLAENRAVGYCTNAGASRLATIDFGPLAMGESSVP